ncbi:DNA cytosine methyltransferase [Deferribacteres bacterium DY0037]
MSYKAIDVFAGAGGLTVGLKNAGIEVVAAIENNKNAADTYKINHPEVNVECKDVQSITNKYLKNLKKSGVNFVAGCPPCQGFSPLTSNLNDPRNKLVLDFLNIITKIDPDAIMMENVPGIVKKGKAVLDKFIEQLEKLNYHVTFKVLQVANYGVPQLRKRFVLFACKKTAIPMPQATHSETGNNGLQKWVSLKELFEQHQLQEPITMKEAEDESLFKKYNWNIVRNLSDLSKKRLQYLKPGSNRFSIPDELRPPCHKGNNKGFSNVYARMSWSSPSPTITSGCTTMSAGRFLHPEKNRTISVREAALIQTFPVDYIFTPKEMEHVCKLVGNALPCHFAEVLTRHFLEHLE